MRHTISINNEKIRQARKKENNKLWVSEWNMITYHHRNCGLMLPLRPWLRCVALRQEKKQQVSNCNVTRRDERELKLSLLVSTIGTALSQRRLRVVLFFLLSPPYLLQQQPHTHTHRRSSSTVRCCAVLLFSFCISRQQMWRGRPAGTVVVMKGARLGSAQTNLVHALLSLSCSSSSSTCNRFL